MKDCPVVPDWIFHNKARERICQLIRERDRYVAMLRLCKKDIEPGGTFEEWVAYLEHLLDVEEGRDVG